MIRFSLFGIPIEIQPMFWIVLAIISSSSNADTSAAILYMALFIIAGTVSILVHELGHALTIRAFGLPTSITLQAFGGFASYPSGILDRKKSFVVTAAGPGAQLALAVIAYLMWDRVPAIYTNPNTSYFFGTLFIISLFWALINLLPVVPLDGGQLLNAVLGPARLRVTLWISIITAVVGGLAMYVTFHSFIFPAILGTYGFQAFQLLQQTKNRWR
ncbi:MAG: site-2 protease family protein [Luteolibacter sp.]